MPSAILLFQQTLVTDGSVSIIKYSDIILKTYIRIKIELRMFELNLKIEESLLNRNFFFILTNVFDT